jgi:hypothetical protein
MLREEKKLVIKAISDLGHRVTAADVASKTGLALSDSTSMLNTIAAEAGGHLEVSPAGDIAYRFKSTFQSAYLATGLRALMGMLFARAFALSFYLVKISFGIFLFLSLIIVVVVFMVVALISAHLGTGREDFRPRELLNFFNVLILRDLIFWGTHKNPASLKLQTGATAENTGGERSRGNFFINCFSFLFGDGNPNAHIDEHKWQLAAQTIRESGGIVIKEQLAPYLGPKLDDENSILPVLARFDGRPAVTAKGNIAYIFPSLQVTTDAHAQNSGDEEKSLPGEQDHLKEEFWRFSKLSSEALKNVIAVAGLNLFGTWWLYFVFNLFGRHPAWSNIMLLYGTLFVCIPMVRLAWQAILNQGIKKRNYRRQQAAKVVSEPDQEIKAKLGERTEFAPAVQIRAVASDGLVFTTERENLEQQLSELMPKEDTRPEKGAS